LDLFEEFFGDDGLRVVDGDVAEYLVADVDPIGQQVADGDAGPRFAESGSDAALVESVGYCSCAAALLGVGSEDV
jgi:hypothetical protein